MKVLSFNLIVKQTKRVLKMIRNNEKPAFVFTLLVWVGIIFIIHSAYSFVHYKMLMKSLGNVQEASSMPSDVQVELLIGFLCALAGIVGASGTLKPAKVTDIITNKDFDVYDHRSDFRIFNHRAGALNRRLEKTK